MLGKNGLSSTIKELKLRELNHRYIFSAKNLYPGDVINMNNINFKRSSLNVKKFNHKNINLY